jgi:type I restriction enzyme, S subunit
MSAIETVTLPRVGTLKMGETIIEKDCTGEGLPIYSADKSNRPWAFSTHFKRLNKRGTIVLGARGTIGHPRLPRDEEFGATQTTITLTPDSENFQSEFVYFVLQQLDFTLLGAQQAIPMLTVGNLESVTIPKFPKPEQTKIAEILSTVDRAIEQTEALIAKQQRLKTGLMQDLLTRGIDEHGNLRSEQTHEFKDSPLGRIPVEWEVRTLDRCVKNTAPICYGILMPGTGYDDGIPVIKVKDIYGGIIHQENLLLTDPKIDSQYKRSRLRSGDLLITIRGTTGRIALVSPELDGANITQDTARLRLEDSCSIEYFYFLLQSKIVQDQVLLHSVGQAVKGINISEVKRISFGLPQRHEQDVIGQQMAKLEGSLGSSMAHLSKLRSLKTALMQDLLTGRKRVTKLLGIE